MYFLLIENIFNIAAAGKSFTEGEFVKKCLLIAASELCPDKKSVFENISLSRMTVQRRVTDISNLSNQQREKAEEFKYYYLAMDGCTDSTDTAQLLIFICGTDENFAVTEELAGLCSMKGCTTEKEVADEVIKCVTETLGLTFDNLVAICTEALHLCEAEMLVQ
jgi:regulator of replication initiation timing